MDYDILLYGDIVKDPAFLFYYQDFLVGTEFMSTGEVGAYVRILCHLADKGSLTKEHMINICRDQVLTQTLMEKFEQGPDGRYFNPRLRDEIEKRRKYVESRKNNRLSGNHMKNICESHDSHMENENENENKGDVGGVGEEGEVEKSKGKKPKEPKHRHGDTVMLTNTEHAKLVEMLGEARAGRAIKILDDYKVAHGRKYASDYRAILNWVVERIEQEEKRGGSQRSGVSSNATSGAVRPPAGKYAGVGD